MERFEPGDFRSWMREIIAFLQAGEAQRALEGPGGDGLLDRNASKAVGGIVDHVLPSIQRAARKMAKDALGDELDNLTQISVAKTVEFLLGRDIDRKEAELASDRRSAAAEVAAVEQQIRAIGGPATPASAEEREIFELRSRLPGLIGRREKAADQATEQRTRNKNLDPAEYAKVKADLLHKLDTTIQESRDRLRSLGVPDSAHLQPVGDRDRQVMKLRRKLTAAIATLLKIDGDLKHQADRRQDRVKKLRHFEESPDVLGKYFHQATINVAVDILREAKRQGLAFSKHGSPATSSQRQPSDVPAVEPEALSEIFWKALARTGYSHRDAMAWVQFRFPAEILSVWGLPKRTQTEISDDWEVGQSAISRKFQRIEARFRVEFREGLKGYLGFDPGDDLDGLMGLLFPPPDDGDDDQGAYGAEED